MGWSSYDEELWIEEQTRWRPLIKKKDEEIENLKQEIIRLKTEIETRQRGLSRL